MEHSKHAVQDNQELINLKQKTYCSYICCCSSERLHRSSARRPMSYVWNIVPKIGGNQGSLQKPTVYSIRFVKTGLSLSGICTNVINEMTIVLQASVWVVCVKGQGSELRGCGVEGHKESSHQSM